VENVAYISLYQFQHKTWPIYNIPILQYQYAL